MAGYSLRGILNCEIEDGVWIVPPQCAVWMPGDLPHSIRGSAKRSVIACSSSPMPHRIFRKLAARFRYHRCYANCF
jgi:hypothetical protein